jgi:hypothetical protein
MDMADDGSVELRGPCPRDVVDLLDAVSMARGLTRTQLVNRVLAEWAADQRHVANVIHRVSRVTPAPVESDGRKRG